MRKMLLLTLAGALAFAACGSDDKEAAPPDAAETTATTRADVAATDTTHHHDDAAGEDAEHEHATDDDGTVTVVDDKGLGMLKNGHHETMVYEELSDKDQAAVDALLADSRTVAAKYPTLADFKAAGAIQAGPFSPGLGIHYTLVTGDSFNPDGVMDKTDMLNPLVAIYDGTEDDAKIAGFMYYSAAEKEPEGFPGPNDFWHYHTDICSVPIGDGEYAPVSADGSDVTPEECASLNGRNMPKTQWMVHVWSVPGYEVSKEDGGVFAEVNPKLDCSDGTYFTMTKVEDRIAHPDNVCRSELSN